ncbi:hypothetical protein BDQ12DRAFT_671642 [Crucibulum laeve]|uniref:Uncharacterized protein n=1 Tax=Crucibulum laeve TaxID=68775 RepID=A0A5C3LG38_9AGAR|nr:hypothetical protein BDQ12DRAFT_671642 [Crucibulum laeve]
MSSPAQRIRTKTSDLTDFFRGGHNSHPRQVQSDTEGHTLSTPKLEVPADNEGAGVTRKRTTRIPFLGRTRKKSNQSTASSPFATSSGTERESSEQGNRSTSAERAHAFPQLTRQIVSSIACKDVGSDGWMNGYRRSPGESSSSSAPPPPLPPIKISSPSLGSKFAAHFTPSKSRTKAPSLHPGRTSPTPSISGTLSPPPTSPRAASFDSGSSGASRARTPTPHTEQPTITVSFSPDNIEEYRDLFTLPQSSKSTTSITASSKPFASSSQSQSQLPSRRHSYQQRKDDPDATPRSSPPGSRRDSPESASSTPKIPQKLPSSLVAAPDTEKNGNGRQRRGSNTPPTPVLPSSYTPAQRYAATALPQTPSSPSFNDPPSSSSLRSRMRTPSLVTESRSRPPTIPLPPPPSMAPPSPPLPSTSETSRSTITPKSLIRPRANTISGASSPLAQSSSSSSPPSTPPPDKSRSSLTQQHPVKSLPSDFDVNTASPEELKRALMTRNQQYDELASYLLKLTEVHVAEIAVLEKKASSLEKEAARKDKEIKGLTWLVVNNRGPPAGVATTTNARPPSALELDKEAARAQSIATTKMSMRRFQIQTSDESGAESHPTSGAESIRGSGTSGTESMSSVRGKMRRRPFTLGESSYNLYRASTTGKRGEHVPNMPYLSASNKRSSVSSTSPSPSSSASSLLPPSPSATVSSLSAIPESALPALRQTPRNSSDYQPDDMYTPRTSSNRLSSSSMSSSTTAASSAYAGNLKRSRPPSIAQILEKSEKSPSMGDSLEKLRPSGGAPSPTTPS